MYVLASVSGSLEVFTHRRKYSNEILPGVDLQILFLVEQVVWYILFPGSFARISSLDAFGSFL